MKVLNKSSISNIALIFLIVEGLAAGVFAGDSLVRIVLENSGAIATVVACYFLADGYKRTSSVGEYGRRILDFWLLSIAPYFLLYRHTAMYKQGVLFDLLLALLVLSLNDHIYANRSTKILGTIGIFLVSLFVSQKPMIVLALVLVFRYVKSQKIRNLLVVVTLASYSAFMYLTAVRLGDVIPSVVNWSWYSGVGYVLGVLALPLLSLYNDKVGRAPLFELFYYAMCPLHYLVLFFYSFIYEKQGLYGFIIAYHSTLILGMVLILFYVMRQQLTKAHACIALMTMCACIYVFGYILEFTSSSLQGMENGIKIEYFALVLLVLFMTKFVSEFTAKSLPIILQILQILVSIGILVAVCFIGENHWFYTSMHISRNEYFHTIQLSYGPVFFIYCGYVFLTEIYLLIMLIRTIRTSEGAETKRAWWLAIGCSFPFLSMLLKYAGWIGDFAPMSTALVIGGLFEMIALFRYGSLDPVYVATQSMLNSSNRGIVILNKFQAVSYYNDIAYDIFPNITLEINFSELFRGPFDSMLEGGKRRFVSGEHIYELSAEPLKKSSYIQGYIISAEDVTSHEEEIQAAKSKASTDALTGLNTRSYYIEHINEYFSHHNTGSLMMIDVDNFKSVNDNYGHDIGDKVLQAVGKSLLAVAGTSYLTCRMGGDEFSVFVPSTVKINTLAEVAQSIIDHFKQILIDDCLPENVTISIGIVTTDNISEPNDSLYENMYRKADNALYLSKSKGKARYNFYK